MDPEGHELRDLLASGETLKVEFKSDIKSLPDKELLAAVVALANTEGGTLLLGVEDDGTVTGVKPKHRDPDGLAAMVANRASTRWTQSSWGASGAEPSATSTRRESTLSLARPAISRKCSQASWMDHSLRVKRFAAGAATASPANANTIEQQLITYRGDLGEVISSVDR